MIEEPTPGEEEYVYMPRSHMITKADLTKDHGAISQSASWRQYVVWVCSRGFYCIPRSAKR